MEIRNKSDLPDAENIVKYLQNWQPESHGTATITGDDYLWLQADVSINVKKLERYLETHYVAHVKPRNGDIRIQISPE